MATVGELYLSIEKKNELLSEYERQIERLRAALTNCRAEIGPGAHFYWCGPPEDGCTCGADLLDQEGDGE